MTTNKKLSATTGGLKEPAAPAKPWRVAKTRLDARYIGGKFPAEPVLAFRVLASAEEKDVQQLLAEAMNLLFERRGIDARFPIDSGRRTMAIGGA